MIDSDSAPPMTNAQPSKRLIHLAEKYRGPFGESIGEVLDEIWRDPKLRTYRNDECTRLIFTFPFSILDELKRRNLKGYYRLFPRNTKKKGLARALRMAYGTARYEGELVRDKMRVLLREVIIEAVNSLLEKHKDIFHQDENAVKEEQLKLRQRVVKKGRPKSVEKIAKRLARRYRELLPEIREVRQFLEDQESRLKAEELPKEIARNFQYSWLQFLINGCALKNRLPIPGHDLPVESLSAEKWTPRQLAVGIIVCEERERDAQFSPNAVTIYEKYIILGNRLIRTK